MQGDFLIGEWVVHPRLNSLERNGGTVHLEPKVMQVLLTLAADPGEVFSRERLRSAVWPDVFVGEDVLIRAISEIRRAFSDDPRSPHTIQTVPKVGYRLIAPVVRLVRQSLPLLNGVAVTADRPSSEQSASFEQSKTRMQETVSAANAANPVSANPVSHSVVAAPLRNGSSMLWSAFALVALSAIIEILAAVRHPVKSPVQLAPYISRPLTTYPGSQLQPAFSPDGNSIAFVWYRQRGQYKHIYIQPLDSEEPVRLTSDDAADELSPAWSPNSRFIAFVRKDNARSSIVIVPSSGGSEREVYTLPVNSAWEYGGLIWTPDGSLVFPQQNTSESPSTLVKFSIAKKTVRELTAPPPRWDGDWTPALAPDGKKLAFVRGSERSARDLYVMNLPDGPVQRLTHDGRLIEGVAWAADSSSIVFSSTRDRSLSLWRIPATGGAPQHVAAVGDDAYGPAIAKRGNRLVYSHGSATWSIFAAKLPGKESEPATRVLTSSEQDASPHISPCGDRIAFQSWRSGSQEIWTAKIDGSNPVQLTSAGASAESPSWSPDGNLIAFDARPDSFAHIYLIYANGRAPRALTYGSYNDVVPSWSEDGHSIYFGSNRSGSWQIWKIAANGAGSPEQVTKKGGMVAMESNSGRWIYITRYAETGIWQRAVTGGPERKIFDGPPIGSQDYWTVYGSNVYSLSAKGRQFSLQRIDPETGHVQTVYDLKHDPTPFAGLSVAPDGKQIIFAGLVRASSHLTLVDGFQ